jgi:hypothetical protein
MNTETNPTEDEEFARLEVAGAKRIIRIVTTFVLAHAVFSLVVVAVAGATTVQSCILPLAIIGTALALRSTFDRFLALLLSVLYAFRILLQLFVIGTGGFPIDLMMVVISLVIPGVLLWLSITAVKAAHTIRKLESIANFDNENKQ